MKSHIYLERSYLKLGIVSTVNLWDLHRTLVSLARSLPPSLTNTRVFLQSHSPTLLKVRSKVALRKLGISDTSENIFRAFIFRVFKYTLCRRRKLGKGNIGKSLFEVSEFSTCPPPPPPPALAGLRNLSYWMSDFYLLIMLQFTHDQCDIISKENSIPRIPWTWHTLSKEITE